MHLLTSTLLLLTPLTLVTSTSTCSSGLTFQATEWPESAPEQIYIQVDIPSTGSGYGITCSFGGPVCESGYSFHCDDKGQGGGTTAQVTISGCYAHVVLTGYGSTYTLNAKGEEVGNAVEFGNQCLVA